MLDLEKKLKPKEFNEFKETVIEWGVDYDLHKVGYLVKPIT
ncbi:MAG: hypothetical protein WDA29_12075 [Flavobacteriaceae bacterium]|jgi:hypothetical protein